MEIMEPEPKIRDKGGAGAGVGAENKGKRWSRSWS